MNILNVPFPGRVYYVKKSFFESIKKYWIETCPHDCLLWRSAVFKGSAYIINEPLITWRKHSSSAFQQELNTNNVSSELKWRNCEKEELYKLLEYEENELKSNECKQTIERNLSWVLLREEWLKNKDLIKAVLLINI